MEILSNKTEREDKHPSASVIEKLMYLIVHKFNCYNILLSYQQDVLNRYVNFS